MTRLEKKIHIIDASGKVLGRLATEIASLLNGKHKVGYTPNVDGGDAVVIKNASQIRVTGKKMEQKEYKRHSLYPGGLKVRPLRFVLKNNPAEVIRLAVIRMIPKNKLRYQKLKRLKIEA